MLNVLLGMRVIESSHLPGDMVFMFRNGEVMHRFIWTANALADQEREIEMLKARLAGCSEALRGLTTFGRKGFTDPPPGSSFVPPCWCDAEGGAGRHTTECRAALAALHEAEKPV
jgi:hypothetical protein